MSLAGGDTTHERRSRGRVDGSRTSPSLSVETSLPSVFRGSASGDTSWNARGSEQRMRLASWYGYRLSVSMLLSALSAPVIRLNHFAIGLLLSFVVTGTVLSSPEPRAIGPAAADF